ncbi:efflux RND transporter periplasmic adaptor subunit [Aestuariirhabdus sp. Z084]|uniref:efflux RND transporter periplasmic adaptor subunit n=1 Tax=Aestuariirhabdus haliotis TaxID=2918751 RepID=UPI00201B412F|nr:efflux RND transporter periplasmic adaptor subunit [Aestuariirhabdus haliotis]MCL6414387.1 efflux RND transporter periplasmic adaptor subunit [Aestuariirhabdus haliotis]MCL6418319.1 efflux RND transporter periplasmic adaptor subunit [Aestuariirhabdus haliotis]
MLSGAATVSAQPSEAVKTITIESAPVVREQRSIPIRTSGRLAYHTETRLAFKTSGLVTEVAVDVGDRIEEGQMLAALDLAELDAQLSSAASNVDQATRDLKRLKGLYKKNVIPLQQLENAQNAFDVAQSTLSITRFNRRLSVIKAPFSGRVLQREIEVNELVNSGTPVFVVAGEQQGWIVKVGLADRDIVRVQLGDRAELRMDPYPDELLVGRVSRIAAAADAATGTFEVEISLPTDDRELRSGFVVRVDILPSSTPKYSFIPIEALVAANGHLGLVFAHDRKTNKVSGRTVDIVALVDDELAVRAGLEGVERVVTEGAPYMKDGLRVKTAQ